MEPSSEVIYDPINLSSDQYPKKLHSSPDSRFPSQMNEFFYLKKACNCVGTQLGRLRPCGRKVAALIVAIGMGYCNLAVSHPGFETEMEAITERVSLAPTEALARLTRLQTENPQLSVENLAMLYEQLNRAKFFANDFADALHYGKLLESLGQKSRNKSMECSGLLAQVYANWRLGNIEAAYTLARQAEQTPAAQITLEVRIRALLAVAQLEADERRPQAALRKIETALQLSGPSDSLQYTVRIIQAKIFIAANDYPNAVNVIDELIALAHRSTFKERLIRVKGVEFTVALAAGRFSRANNAMAEQIRLMKRLHLTEGLGGVLVEYADFKLNRREYAAALNLSTEALGLTAVQLNEQLVLRAKFNRALSKIQMGKVPEGKIEIEKLFKSNPGGPQLLNYLSQYAAALTEAGEGDASLQIAILRRKLESEIELTRAKEVEKSRGTMETLSRENALISRETVSAHGQRNVWLAVAVLSVVGLLALIRRYVRLHAGTRALSEANRKSELALEESTMRQTALRQQALEAQLRILQAQIEPHFLFNTLANLRYLYRTNLSDGEEMLDHLIGYLRSTMDELRSDSSTIGRELQLTQHYLSIMGIRMGDRLQYNISCAREVADTPFPPAMLLTLVENAIKHGLQNRMEGRIDIVVTLDDQSIWLTVLDNGAGVSDIEGTGVGLTNVRQRLEAAYGKLASLQAGPLPNGGFAASIMLPFVHIEEATCQPQ